jgi:hypothetical protein
MGFLGKFTTPGEQRPTDEIMEDVRGRKPGEPLS